MAAPLYWRTGCHTDDAVLNTVECLLHNGRELWSSRASGIVEIYDVRESRNSTAPLETIHIMRQTETNPGRPTCLFASKGTVWMATRDGYLIVIDSDTLEVKSSVRAHEDSICAIVQHPKNEDDVWTVCVDGTLSLWSASRMALRGLTYRLRSDGLSSFIVAAAMFHNDLLWLVSGTHLACINVDDVYSPVVSMVSLAMKPISQTHAYLQTLAQANISEDVIQHGIKTELEHGQRDPPSHGDGISAHSGALSSSGDVTSSAPTLQAPLVASSKVRQSVSESMVVEVSSYDDRSEVVASGRMSTSSTEVDSRPRSISASVKESAEHVAASSIPVAAHVLQAHVHAHQQHDIQSLHSVGSAPAHMQRASSSSTTPKKQAAGRDVYSILQRKYQSRPLPSVASDTSDSGAELEAGSSDKQRRDSAVSDTSNAWSDITLSSEVVVADPADAIQSEDEERKTSAPSVVSFEAYADTVLSSEDRTRSATVTSAETSTDQSGNMVADVALHIPEVDTHVYLHSFAPGNANELWLCSWCSSLLHVVAVDLDDDATPLPSISEEDNITHEPVDDADKDHSSTPTSEPQGDIPSDKTNRPTRNGATGAATSACLQVRPRQSRGLARTVVRWASRHGHFSSITASKQYVMAGTAGGAVYFFHAGSKMPLCVIKAHTSPVRCLVVPSGDDRFTLASGSESGDGSIVFFSMKGEHMQTSYIANNSLRREVTRALDEKNWAMQQIYGVAAALHRNLDFEPALDYLGCRSVITYVEGMPTHAIDAPELTMDGHIDARRWDAVLRSKHQDRQSSRMFLLCRRGIPATHRPRVWKMLTAQILGDTRKFYGEGYYHRILKHKEGKSSENVKQIDLDLARTLSQSPCFNNNRNIGTAALRRLLIAFSWHNPRIGYCQGMNRLAAFCLLNMEDEEEAFWCFVAVVENIMGKQYFCAPLTAARADQLALLDLLRKYAPGVAARVESLNLKVEAFTFLWFFAAFVGLLPSALTLHIWDALLCEGASVLFRFALALLKANEKHISEIHSRESLRDFFKFDIGSFSDKGRLAEMAFKELDLSLGNVEQLIKRKREQFRQQVEKEDAELGVSPDPWYISYADVYPQ